MADHDALESALQKIAGLELSEAEVNALAEALASDNEVEGFAMSPKAGKGWIIIESLVPKPLLGDDFGVPLRDSPKTGGYGMKESGEKGGPPRR